MRELKPLHTDNTVEVPRRVWNQVEGRLKNKKQQQKLFRLKVISGVAACLLVAVGLSYISLGFNSDQSQFASNGNYKSIVFEDLSTESSYYDFDQVVALKSAIIATDPNFAKRHK